MTLKEAVVCNNQWYLDSGCSTHMMGRKDCLFTINRAMKNKVKFADVTTLTIEGIIDVSIERMYGRYSSIKNVFYIPENKCNLLSTDQLLEKD